ncbi:MAG: hypothetical protein KJ601_04945 [Nanoarchaeota archaeon]|nr:hypothetical protein [Nanoarchaeota archaeon]MBU1704968.1 hypothetical protein [Nanoarchaeota archaeon]
MAQITQKEGEALLALFKGFSTYYNANSLSKYIGISHVGAQKILKRFLEEGLTDSRNIGRSIVHKPKLDNDYAEKLITFLLADEANNHKRWKEEFKGLVIEDEIILIYGSAIKNYKTAEDIDIMIIGKEKNFKEIDEKIKDIQETLPKKIHALKLTKQDFLKNINNKKKAIIDLISNAIVLYGHYSYVELMRNVTSF